MDAQQKPATLMVVDGAALGAIFVGSLVLRFGSVWPTYSLVEYAYSTLVLCGVLVGGLKLAGMYGSIAGPWHALQRASVSLLAAGLA